MKAKSGVTRRHELERNTRTAPHKTRRIYTYAMRDTSGASVDVTRVSKSGSGNTAAEWVVNGETAVKYKKRGFATCFAKCSRGEGGHREATEKERVCLGTRNC